LLLKVGISETRLSFVQADLVCRRLLQAVPGLSLEKKVVLPNKNDLNRRNPLVVMRNRRAVDREIDRAVLDGRVDFAVCDMRKVPLFDENSRLVIAGVPERGSPADVLVSRGDQALKELEEGSVLGVSSPVRVAQLARVRPDLRTERVSGDLIARIDKVDRRKFDGIIVAEAGVARLGLTGRIAQRFSLKDFVPFPGQGAIAAIARRDDYRVCDLIRSIEHSPTRVETVSERELVRVLATECKVPVAALASCTGDSLELTARVLSADGREEVRTMGRGDARDPIDLARKLGGHLIDQGAEAFEEGWRKLYY